MPFSLGAFVGKVALGWAVGALFGRRRRELVDAQRRPNEITSSGQATAPTVFPLGEIPVPGLEVYRGVEVDETTGRTLHLAFALAEGPCESPTGVRIDEELLSAASTAAVGPRITATAATSDGGVQWSIINGRGGRGRITWYLRADGTQGASLRDAADRMGTDSLPFGDQHRGHGVSWCHVELVQPPHRTAENRFVWPPDVPAFEFVLKGLKLRRVDTGAVEWTQNAADVRWWLESRFLGFDASRIDLTTARAARALCARTIDLDRTTTLGHVRFCFRLTAADSAPSAPSGAAYPPGGGWTTAVPTPTTALPYGWIAFQDYDETAASWNDWGRVRAFLRPRGGETVLDRPDRPVAYARTVLSASRATDAAGNDRWTIDPASGDTRLGGSGPSSRIDLGPPGGGADEVVWTFNAGSQPEVLSSLVQGSGAARISRLRFRPTTNRAAINIDLDVSAELVSSWETGDDTIELVRPSDGDTFELDGPANPDNRRTDRTSPYSWRTRVAWSTFRSWISATNEDRYWLVLRTGPDQDDAVFEVPPGEQPGASGSRFIPLFNADRNFQVYGVNGVITGADFSRWSALRNELDIAWAGRVVLDGGRMYFWPGQDSASAATLGPATGETTYVRSSDSISTRVNVLTAELNQSRVHGFRRWSMRPLVDRDALDRDGRRLQRDLGVRGFVTSPAQLEVLLAMQLRAFRAQRVVTRRERLTAATLGLRPGQRVTLLDEQNGFRAVTGGPLRHQGNADGRFLQVLSRRVHPTALTVDLDLVEHFDRTHDPVAWRFPQLEPDVTAPGAAVAAPSGLTVTAVSEAGYAAASTTRLVVSWTPVVEVETIVQWRPVVPSGGSIELVGAGDLTVTPDWGRGGRERSVAGAGVEIPVRDGLTWEVRIRHVSRLGLESSWSAGVTAAVGARLRDQGCQARNVRLSAVIPTIALRWDLPPVGCQPPQWLIQYAVPGLQGDRWGAPFVVAGNSEEHVHAPANVLATIYATAGIPNTIQARIQPLYREGGDHAGGAALATAAVTVSDDDDPPEGPAGPLTIRDLTATAGQGQIVLTWTSPNGVEPGNYWEIQRKHGNNAYPSSGRYVLVDSGAPPWTDTGVAAGTVYTYRIRFRSTSTSRATLGPWSDEVTASSASGAVTAPSAPRNVLVAAGNPADSRLGVSWSAPSRVGTGGGLNYRVEIRRDGEPQLFKHRTGLTQRSWTFSNLEPSTTYWVKVIARTTHGQTSAAEVSRTTGAAPSRPVVPPGRPPPPTPPAWTAWQYGTHADVVSDTIGDVDVGSNAAEADGNIWTWGTSGEWSGQGRPRGQTASGVMATLTHDFGGAVGRQVLQVFQSGTTNANTIRRTDTDTVIGYSDEFIFTGDLDTRRSKDHDFVDVVKVHDASNRNLPGSLGTVRALAFLRWNRRGAVDGSGVQSILFLHVVAGFFTTTVRTRSYG